ncbi:hypothetical protein MKK67_20805 [Methylobacterium sp. J-072]|uniref:hypothetical protein n=1 Tax=Methylobacterium sp. J-072 TaxID=2836651 RepID=UPI001FBAD359|nr:hypothetical protein [Methylobacterium sp. J-072]MCJ2094921.1 hypothetical protein [Methylobacterium sp. J-072]
MAGTDTSKNAFHVLQDEKVIYQINDARLNNTQDKITLQISVIDKLMPDAAYADMQTRVTTVMKKTAQQGGNLSAHLVINIDPYKANTHLCLLEGVRRLNATSIYRLLNRLIRDAHQTDNMRFSYPDPGGAKTRDGAPKRHSYLPLVRLNGHPSPTLIRDLENGDIRNIKLTKTKEATAFSDSEFLTEESYELTLGIKPEVDRKGLFAKILGAVTKHKDDYKTGRIAFTDQNRNNHNLEFDVETGEPASEDFIKYTTLRKINPPLADASPTIVGHMEAEMLALLAVGPGA